MPPISVRDGAATWRSSTLAPDDWRVAIPDAVVDELRAAIVEHERDPVPLPLVDPNEFDLVAARRLAAHARRILDDGCGVVVLDRLPDDLLVEGRAEIAFWLFGALVGRPVSQNLDGEFLVRVTDEGVPKRIGIRGYRTNAGQRPHIDNSFNAVPPDQVSLLGINTAAEGGLSRFVSFATVHAELAAEAPDLLARLYEPMLQDRQGAFHPDEAQTVDFPVFEDDGGRLRCRYTHFTIPAGYQTAGVPMDERTAAAFGALTELVDDPDLHLEFRIERGHIQIVNNRFCGHGRTAYRDDPVSPRLLLRLWHRDHGRRRYTG